VKALLIHNLSSGQHDRRDEIASAISRLTSAGWDVDLFATHEIHEVEPRVRQAVAEGVDTVVIAGGDGTLNAAVQALARQRAALGVIPVGTTNVWAREMRVPLDVRGATQVLVDGETARVDLGEANGRYFLFVAGIGFDASVTRCVDPKTKRRLGMIAYIIAAATEALKLRGEEVVIACNGETTRQRALMVVATNTRIYGGVLAMAPEAYADDGLLDVWVFRGRGLLAALRHTFNVILGLHRRDPEARYFQTSAVTVDSKSRLPVQLDGDYFGTTPVNIRVAPGALRVLVPSGHHPQLLGRSARRPRQTAEN